MKKIICFLIIIGLFSFCGNQKECCVNVDQVNVLLKFTQNWNGVPVTSSDFNDFKYTTANGETLSILGLRYLLSNISVGETIKNYHLVNVGENTGLELNFDKSASGETFLKFTFGFADLDNIDGIYQDLNSVSFNVPEMLGGGYHFMQFDGKYKDIDNQDASFNYHTIRAVNITNPSNLIFNDTSFEFEIGTLDLKENTTIEIKMNIAEWFKNPNIWDLNELNTVLMPNFDAQKMMSTNGRYVFSLGNVTP